MAVKPKNEKKDSWAYTLPHEIGFAIQELAKVEAKKLQLSKLSTSAYLERIVRQLAEENLSEEVQKEIQIRAERRTKERHQEVLKYEETDALKGKASKR